MVDSTGISLNKVFDNIWFMSQPQHKNAPMDNAGMSSVIKLTTILNDRYNMSTHIFNEKFKDSFEIDIENKVLYRTVKSYSGYPSSIIDIPYKVSNQNVEERHPTTKPVEVLEYLIKKYTKEGDVVLDMTMGSGSTGVACKNLDRSFIRNRNWRTLV